jgi:RNA polymerase sigma-70 factor (ECF subfamily)
MNQASADLFSRLRPRLMAIGYRMLASVQEAEDLVQDVWLRWHDEVARMQTELLNPEAWLVTVTTRMAIDRLRSAKLRRQAYPGMWFPEPLLEESPPTPEQIRARSDDVSIAFLLLLDCLTPEARAAFLLREVFEVDYDQIAAALGKSEAASRQIVSRAKLRLDRARAAKDGNSTRMPPKEQHDLLRRLIQAIEQGEFGAIQALLAEDAALMGDFGGIAPSLVSPLRGGRRIAQLYYANHLRHGGNMRLQLAKLNGEWALLRFLQGELDSVQSFEFDGDRILRVRIQRNPEKLATLSQLHRSKRLVGWGGHVGPLATPFI